MGIWEIAIQMHVILTALHIKQVYIDTVYMLFLKYILQFVESRSIIQMSDRPMFAFWYKHCDFLYIHVSIIVSTVYSCTNNL